VAVGIFEFGDFKLDCGTFELRRDGHGIKLERKPMELLILLASKEGQLVTRAEIASRLWNSEVFDDTEHGINTAIRKIRQVLRDDPEEPRFVQTVTGMGYRFIAPIVFVRLPVEGESQPAERGNGANASGPPTALAASSSAVPEPAPAIETAESPVEPSTRQPHRARLVIWLAAGAFAVCVLLVAVIVLGPRSLANRWLHRSTQPAISSLAVIPLDNLSGDPGQDYSADGMTDELITMLAKNSTTRIVSRTSVMQYKGVHKPLPEIARELGVDGILEGSIARTGSQIHMTLQLIRADTHLWAESYDRNSNDVAALPGEAARAIAGRLHSSVPASTAARYVHPEAHDAYLRGRHLWFRGQMEEAGKYFQNAVDLQPDYAPGWAGLSSYYGESAVDGIMNPLQAQPQAEACARKDVALDDQLSDAHLNLGAAFFFGQWDWAHGLDEISRAIELDRKDTQAIHIRARFLSILGRHQEAIQAQKTANELAPFERPWAMVAILNEARQYDAAIEEAHQRLQADLPLPGHMYELIALAYRGKGVSREWADAYEKQLQLSGDPASAAAVQPAFQQGGQKAVVHWQLARLERKSRTRYVSPVDLAELHAQLDDRDMTLTLLEQGFREHSPLLLWLQFDPAYDFLHSDERYRSIIGRVGLPPAY
jgi:TolB-like protein/DNA-binding winged helix-turn-helix (wHTH) protein